MSFKSFFRVYFMTDLENQAIQCSIKGDWKQAVKLNLQILKKLPKDIDALNRLSYAYIQTGKTNLSKKTSLLVLKIDPFNLIATKNIVLLKNFSRKDKNPAECLENNLTFIENPGSAKLISLICPAPRAIICKVRNGADLHYKIKRRKISISHGDTYIGCFPDDLSRKYISMMNRGLKFEIFFKSYNLKKISVLVKEKNV